MMGREGWTATAGTITLFDGALDYSAQGWTLTSASPSYTANIVEGALELGTTTASGAFTGGHALLWRTLPTAMGAPFTFEVDLRLIAASRHNPSDAGAAILASFTPVFGMPAQRSQMIYLETDRIGWANDSASAAVDLDDAFHTVRFSIDSDDLARVTVDGTEVLTRSSFETNGNIAIGDQTNDPNVDGTMRIRAVRLVCP